MQRWCLKWNSVLLLLSVWVQTVNPIPGINIDGVKRTLTFFFFFWCLSVECEFHKTVFCSHLHNFVTFCLWNPFKVWKETSWVRCFWMSIIIRWGTIKSNSFEGCEHNCVMFKHHSPSEDESAGETACEPCPIPRRLNKDVHRCSVRLTVLNRKHGCAQWMLKLESRPDGRCWRLKSLKQPAQE